MLKFRLEYLKRLKDHDELEVVLRSIWKAQHINTENEGVYFRIFASKIDNLFDNKANLVIIHKLLNDFGNFLNNRSLSFLVDENGALPVILKWHVKSCSEEGARVRREQEKELWYEYNNIKRVLDGILKSVLEKSLGSFEAYLYFEILEKHITSIKDQYYLNYFFDKIYLVLFEKISESPERYNIWSAYYPAVWKITKENLEDEHNIAVKIILHRFLRWAQDRILSPPETDYDFTLEEVTRELFPEVDPIEWARILIFILSPRDPTNTLKFLIESRWTFGHIGRVHVGFDLNIQTVVEKERKNTIELAFLLFADEYKKENLERYVMELRSLKYEAESKHESHRVSLLRIFEDMLRYLAEGT